MFNNFVKWSTGRTNIKVISIILILTLTFANFALIGSSIARDNLENSATAVDNVKFSVYLDEGDKTKVSLDADMNDEVSVFVSVSVENGGVLKDAVITLEESNFKIKDQEENVLEVGRLQSGQSFSKEIKVVAVKDENYNLNLLNMQSKIKLTGTYVNNQVNETAVDSTKIVTINWNTKNINEENRPIKLEQRLVTNKIYEINGTEKRVLQFEVISGIENNVYPIKDTTITLSIPVLQNDVEPESIAVTSYGTYATNGDNGTNFVKEYTEEVEGEEVVKGNWHYDTENKEIVMNIKNNETEENKVISWKKGVEDKFIVTYVYDRNTDITSIESTIDSNINLYGNLNARLSKQIATNLANAPEQGEAIIEELAATEKVYRSNMSLGKETEFKVLSTIDVGYSKVGNEIIVSNEKDQMVLGENEPVDANTYYKATTVNKNELLKVLGEEGTLNISYIK